MVVKRSLNEAVYFVPIQLASLAIMYLQHMFWLKY